MSILPLLKGKDKDKQSFIPALFSGCF